MAAHKWERDAVPLTGFLLFLGVPTLAVLVPLVPLGLAPGMTALSILSMIAALWRQPRLPRPDLAVLTGLVLFLAWTGISLFWTVGGDKALIGWAAFLYMLVPGLLYLTRLSEMPAVDVRRVVRWLLPAAVLALALFALEDLADQPIQHLASRGKTPLDMERDINRAALLVALVTGPVALTAWRAGQRLAAAIGVAVVVLLTGVSSSQSAAAAMLGLLVLLGMARLSPRLVAAVIALGILAGMIFCGTIAQWMTAQGLPQADWLPLSFRHRMMTWNFVAGQLDAHPWLGWGLEASRAIPGGNGYFVGTPGWPVLPLHPHNFFLQVRLELGWVGAAVVTLFLLAILRLLLRAEAGLRPMALALFGTCIFAQCFAYGAWQTWLLSGMLFAATLLVLAGRLKAPA